MARLKKKKKEKKGELGSGKPYDECSEMVMMPFICSYRNKNEGLQADGAGEQVDIGIGAERRI